MSETGYLMVALGVLLAYMSVLQLLLTVHTVTAAVAWGVAAAVGILTLGVGTSRVVRGGRRRSAADPEKAVHKTDSRFGRR